MRIFVTGATGVVGRRAVPPLVRGGHEVTAAARTPDRAPALERFGARPVVLDLFDADAVRRALAGHDVLINLATHIPRSTVRMLMPGEWRENDRVRRDASRILADAALAGGVARFIQESFAPIYPDCGDRWIDESTPLAPAHYNRTVVDAERSAERFGAGGGAGVVLRFAGFYGPDATQSRAMMRIVRRGWSPLTGSPAAYFSSVSHDDAATAVVAALDVPAGAYNVTDDRPLTRREYVDAIADAVGAPHPKFGPPWLARLMGSVGELLSRSVRISNRKLREASAWTPRYPSAVEGWRAVGAAASEATDGSETGGRAAAAGHATG